MRRFGFGLLVLTTFVAQACASQPPAPPQPTVTARGTAGGEDVPEVAIRQVTLKAGETLLVSVNDEEGDAVAYWQNAALRRDAATTGAGFYTMVYSVYSAGGGTGDIVVSHASGGDLTFNAYSVTGLAASPLDKTASAQGMGTSPSSGATAATTHANEFLWGSIGYATNKKAAGTWNDGFVASGAHFTQTDGISGVDDGYKTVSSTGTYTAAKTGVDKDAWAALIATYAIATGK